MVERKLYKTKLCVLYQKGRCNRQSCSFAHGNAELRRSFNAAGRRDYGSRDLREKLDRRRSPVRRYSPPRDARGRHASHGESPPRSLGRRSDPKNRKKQQLDGQSDFSGSLKSLDGTEDQVIGKKQGSSDSRDILDEKLRQVQSEVNMLLDHKCQLELYIDERVQEADSLTSKIQELEMQLNKEQAECKRITSKIKKFIKAYNRHSRLQDELKRSYTQLEKLGEKLSSDTPRHGTNAEDSSINITSDEELAGNSLMRPRNEQQKNVSSSRKRSRTHRDANRASNQENAIQGEGTTMGRISKKANADNDRNNGFRPLVNSDKTRKEKNLLTGVSFADKSKFSELGLELPSTCIAAHAVDEVVEIVEMDEKVEAVGTAAAIAGKDDAAKIPQLAFPPPPPPPPIPHNAYSQYKGNDESVDIDGVDEEMADVDII